jgi:MerR family transcriptional regulator, light-induced transcriptional regulator
LDLENTECQESEGLSIGALSRATGISIHSLRMWERRYGSPVANRRHSGHRRYSYSEVDRLRAVERALSAGFRASEVVCLTVKEIDEMLAMGKNPNQDRRKRHRLIIETNQVINEKADQWIEAAENFDEPYLAHHFEKAWTESSPLSFLVDRLVPFTKRIGDSWQCGDFPVAKEHFAIQQLSDFIASKWRSLNLHNTGRPFIFATLPQDYHLIGLQMSALLTTFYGGKVLFLGRELPEDEILATAKQTNAQAVCLSISGCIASRFVLKSLKNLIQELPDETHLVCGGDGVPNNLDGITFLRSFQEFTLWLEKILG